MFTTTLYRMNFGKKNNLTQSIGCFFDEAEQPSDCQDMGREHI